jgi:colanic acid biosynthesis protein WcaH
MPYPPAMADKLDLGRNEPKPGEWIAPHEFAEIIRLTPLVAIDLIVFSPTRRVLLGRRTNEPARGVFFVPGSRITKNETRAAAFRRITQEELGIELELEVARFCGVYEHLYPSNRFELAGFGTHYITLAYELELSLETSALPKDQHTEFAWMTPAEILDSEVVHENTKAYFRRPAV